MSAKWRDNKVQEIIFLSEDNINHHIKGTLNIAKLLQSFRKRCQTYLFYAPQMPTLLSYTSCPSCLFMFCNASMQSKITHWAGIMPPLFGSMQKKQRRHKEGLRCVGFAQSACKKGFFLQLHAVSFTALFDS